MKNSCYIPAGTQTCIPVPPGCIEDPNNPGTLLCIGDPPGPVCAIEVCADGVCIWREVPCSPPPQSVPTLGPWQGAAIVIAVVLLAGLALARSAHAQAQRNAQERRP